MMFFIDALALGFIAAIWSSEGALNIFIKLVFVALTIVNTALAAPLVMSWLPQ